MIFSLLQLCGSRRSDPDSAPTSGASGPPLCTSNVAMVTQNGGWGGWDGGVEESADEDVDVVIVMMIMAVDVIVWSPGGGLPYQAHHPALVTSVTFPGEARVR